MNGKIKQIFVLQETREGEGRVALTPSTISLIDEESLAVLPKEAVVIDLTVNEGASVAKAKSDQVVVSNGFMIVHVSGYPKAEHQAVSEVYAKCMVHLLADILSSEGEIRLEHALLQECWITHNGECNTNIRGKL